MKKTKKVIYVRQEDRNYVSKKEKILKKISKALVRVRYESLENGLIILIPKYKQYSRVKRNIIISKINKITSKFDNYKCVFAKNLEFLEEKYSSKTIKGKGMLKDLSIEIFEYIFDQCKTEMQLQNIHIFVNNYSKDNVNLIKRLIYYFKTVNIITENLKYYKLLENKLFEQGILITVSNNKRKSAINANYIINIDFEKDKILKYKINECAIILNCTNEKKLLEKSFKGIIVNNVSINIDENIKEFIKEFYGNINNSEFLECMLIQNYNNIRWEDLTKKYNTQLNKLYGIRGIISCQEISNLSRYLNNNYKKEL